MTKEASKTQLEAFCRGILQTDGAIRFAGLTTAMGSLLASAYRPGLVPILSPEETARYAVSTAMRAATRDDFESKLGQAAYVLARYPKLVRATITIGHQEKKHLLMLSFDPDSDFIDVLESKVIPFLKQNKGVLGRD